jgi:alkyldihydroxyacetonephosphate synthase
MRWYGWGTEAQAFNPQDRPGLWPYAAAHLGISAAEPRWHPIDPGQITLPPRRVNDRFLDWLRARFAATAWSDAPTDRLRHATGRSTFDVWHLRLGLIDAAPDYVVFPAGEQDIIDLIDAATSFGVVLIPFGGGTNVAGCLTISGHQGRVVVSVDLRRMNRVIDIDTISGLVRVEAGILGPALEAALERAGFTLGHFPDSFLYSTLGGWVATRSSGMLSDAYGNIEDMVVGIRVVTPAGVLDTRPLPHASNGPDVKRFMIGSEGTLGVITKLTMRIRPRPARREYRGYLFRNFAAGIDAIREASLHGVAPAMSRLNDPAKTQLSAAFRRRGKGRVLERLLKFGLTHLRGIDLGQSCLMIGVFEGEPAQIRTQRRAAEQVWRQHGAIGLGTAPGRALEESKFDLPYVRDFLMDYNVVVDVAETCVLWKHLPSVYGKLMQRTLAALRAGGRNAWLGCHISHCYSSGASLYFTFAFRCRSAPDGRIDRAAELAHYRAVNTGLLDGFAECGCTLSHHHAVGRDHLRWLKAETAIGRVMPVEALKAAVDPSAIMNPGKLAWDPTS